MYFTLWYVFVYADRAIYNDPSTIVIGMITLLSACYVVGVCMCAFIRAELNNDLSTFNNLLLLLL